MPAAPSTTVVSCGVRFNANTGLFHARVSVQVVTGVATRYEKYHHYAATWADIAAWFATFP